MRGELEREERKGGLLEKDNREEEATKTHTIKHIDIHYESSM